MGTRRQSSENAPLGRLRVFVLLWLTGFSIRVTLLAVPPLLPRIAQDLQLTNTEVAALTTLPLLLFSVAATLGSGVVWLAGARRTVVAGLLLAGAAAALRGTASSTVALFVFTLLMGLGIAAVQPAVPSLVRAWVPRSIGRATAVYVNGILVSEAAAASLTLPVVLPALGTWELALAVWAIPVIVTAVLVSTLAEKKEPQAAVDASRWVPAWSEGRTWRLGLFQASGSVAYFASNAVIPVYLLAQDRPDLIGWTLASLNVSQLLASILVAVLPVNIVTDTPARVIAGVAVAGAAAGLVGSPDLAVLWGGIIGLGSAFIFTVSLALPALLARGREVARLSAGMFTIGYALAFLIPLAGGALWDATGSAWTALAPVIMAGLGAIVVGGEPTARGAE
jgi:CP family cyanate transporter-like MFS transporter